MPIYQLRVTKILSILLSLVITISTLPIGFLHADPLTHGEYNCSPLSIEYVQNSTWGCNTQGQYTVTNESAYNVLSWTIAITYADEVTVTDIWNANNSTSGSSEQITITSNTAITAGSTCSFGMIVTGSEEAPAAPISISLVNIVTDEPTPTPTPTEEPTPTNEPTEEPTNTPTVTVTPTPSEEQTEVFPYAIFSASTTDDFVFQGWKSDIVGDIYSGKDFLYQGSELTMTGFARTVGIVNPSGWKTSMTGAQEHIQPLTMPDWSLSIFAKEDDMPSISETDLTAQDSVIANGYYYTNGNITINGAEFTGDAVIVAHGDITYNVNSLNAGEEATGRILLYSEEGNITINGTQIEVNGILYAPNGRVSINAYNTTLNGRIVADKFSYNGSILNVTADPSDLQLVSELPQVTVTASSSQVTEGQTAYFTIEIPQDNVYEILYRLNGTNVEVTIPDNEEDPIRYNLNTDSDGIYTLEAYVELPYGTFVLDSDTITVTAEPTSTPTNTPTPTEEPTETPTATPTNTPSPTITVTPTPTETPIPTSEPTVTDTPTPTPDYSTDSDEDYLPDTYELEIGTDPNDPDSDSDGIPDGIEVVLGYDPDEPDTDGDQINDGNEDFDSDGLSNIYELTIGTEIAQADTDYDGLYDGEEVNTYDTDPLLYDTDEDGISDGDEIYIGKDPNDPADGNIRLLQTTSEQISNQDDPFITSVDVSISLANRIDRVLTIDDLYDIDVYSTGVVGRLGSPIGFECEETFTEATIVIHYNESQLNNTHEENLGILWYDEEHGLYIIQDQAVVDTVNDTITLAVDHFSTYVVVDLDVWNNIEPIEYSIPMKEKTFDYIFVLDKSVSFDQKYQALELLYDFAGHMRSGDRIATGFFSSDPNPRELIYWQVSEGNDVSDFLDGVTWNYIHGVSGGNYGSYEQALRAGTGMYECLKDAYGEINNEKQLIIITADTDKDYQSLLCSGLMNESCFSGVTVVSTEYRDQLSPNAHGKQFANNIGGYFYNYGDYGNSIWDEFYSNYGGLTEDWSDIDKDGVADFMEEQGIQLSNGEIVYTLTDPTIGDDGHAIGYDSDGDTLSDGEELGTMYTVRIYEDNGNRVVELNPDIPYISTMLGWFVPQTTGTYYLFAYYSDPTQTDTDRDYYNDNKDPRPKRNDIRTIGIEGRGFEIIDNEDYYYTGVCGFPGSSVGEISIGGNQNWFVTESSEWSDEQTNEYIIDHYIKQHGCGLIAYNDIGLYFTNGIAQYCYEDYYDLVHQAYCTLGCGATPIGVFFGSIAINVEEILRQNGRYCFVDFEVIDPLNPDPFLQSIKSMIRNGYPVIINVYDNDENDNWLKFYIFEKDDGELNTVYQIDATGHYFTVTGVVYDAIKDEYYLRVSNNGKEEYVSYREYVEFVINHVAYTNCLNYGNGIIHIREI